MHKPYLILFRVETFDHRKHWWQRHHRRLIEEATLIPNGELKMSTVTVSVGHTVACSLVFLDQSGNPMLVTPVPDAPPTWSDTTPATGTLTPAPDGLTANEVALVAGNDTINMSLAVGGVSFAASVGVVVSSAPQVLTSVQITTTVN